jgi:hypothetical protein
MNKSLFLVVISLTLIHCGGGSSSTGAGTTDPAFDVSPFVGTWVGTLNATVTITSTGQTVPVSQPWGVRILPTGQIASLEPTVGASPPQDVCQGLESAFLTSNPFTWNATYECIYRGIGKCSITEVGEVTITGNTALGTFSGNAVCGPGNVPVRIVGNFGLTKQP